MTKPFCSCCGLPKAGDGEHCEECAGLHARQESEHVSVARAALAKVMERLVDVQNANRRFSDETRDFCERFLQVPDLHEAVIAHLAERQDECARCTALARQMYLVFEPMWRADTFDALRESALATMLRGE